MTTRPQLDIRRMVIIGTARRPDLATDLQRAADLVKYDPPKLVSTDARLWLVPSEKRPDVSYLVDRTAKTCAAPECRQKPRRPCAHRLAVEMVCRLDHHPHPPDAT